ncbi:trehalose-phosphatase [Coxiella burnetii]|uniref:trehalose-phosphatase n=1 Tax=Coxiella burnetii TaxID=777 RepID=UPI0022314634|nr:trehalose-phosphatase [Coxiella burnetii]
MSIEVGQKAPIFTLPTDEGEMLSLDDLKGKKVILYFYPKDDTPGCTKEACGFRDVWSQLSKAGAVVLGISKDSVKAHQSFKQKYNLPFTLLSDKDNTVCEVLQKLGLNGKPHPDMFLEAAARLQTSPLDCVIFEDALSGVQAGARGYFGLVVGIARQPDMRGPLKQMGADWVVDDLDAVTVNQLVEKMPDSLPNALECLPCIAEQSAYKKMVVFLDYDGTLTPIVDKPEKAILSDEMKAVLIKLSQKASVVVLSGRQLSNLQELIGLESLFYAGNHGFEIFNPLSNDTIVIVTEYKETISNAYNLLHQLLQDVQGVIIEHKALSLSIHYRLVKAEDVPIIEENLDKVLELHPQLKKHHGKKVFELRPHIDWDKGKALLHILEILSHHYAHIYPIFLGDDVTDEDAFMAIEDCGVGILVSKEQRRTSAAMVLEDPKQVEQFLEALTHLA